MIRLFLVVEAATFVVAALVHFGVLLDGFQDRTAGTAESVIAVVLGAGLALSWARPAWTRGSALVTQGFALLGTLVGLSLIVGGIGPQTVPDVVYHVTIAGVLLWGLVVAARGPRAR